MRNFLLGLSLIAAIAFLLFANSLKNVGTTITVTHSSARGDY